MSRTGAEIRQSETQSKFIQERISKVEKHFGDFCEHMAGYSRKLSKVRDKGDDVSTAIMSYAENESHNPSTKLALRQFSENFSAVQDYRETQIRRLDDKVVGPLTMYGDSCKAAKERLKSAFAARKKEIAQQEKLHKVKDKAPSDRPTIAQAERELQSAGVQAAKQSRTLEDEMDGFEQKKLTDIKRMLQDFVNIELIYHAKALEMYTVCYQNLAEIDEHEDLEEFRNSLRPGQASTRMELQRAHSKTSLNSTSGMNGTGNQSRGTTPAQARKNQPLTETANTTGKSSMYSEYDDDEEESEEEETDDDDGNDEYLSRYQSVPAAPQPPPRPPQTPTRTSPRTPTKRPPTQRSPRSK